MERQGEGIRMPMGPGSPHRNALRRDTADRVLPERRRNTVNACILAELCLLALGGGDLSGRYSGVATGKKPDGTGPEIPVFLILQQEGSSLSCTAGLDSFDENQKAGRDASIDGNAIRFSMPWGGGVRLELQADGEALSGTLRPLPGVSPVPFDRVLLKRVGELTLSDRIPRLAGEGTGARSTRILQLRRDLKDGRAEALPRF